MKPVTRNRICALVAVAAALVCRGVGPPDKTYDVAVYDATPGGVAFAVRAAREGLTVMLVSHSAHPGGILSSGLSVFDTLYNGSRAPIYDELRDSIYRYYRDRYGADSPQYRATLPGYPKTRYEAHVMEQLVAGMLGRESRITTVSEYYPIRGEREGSLVRSVTFHAMNGPEEFTVRARVFCDCSYEGDLAAALNIPMRVGRESRGEFGEPHAGRILMRPVHWPPPNAPSLDDNRGLNLVRYNRAYERVEIAGEGVADPAVQAYNLRTVLTDDPANRIPPTKPAHYDPAQLAKLRYAQVIGPLPNRKYCWNLPELIGEQTAYVNGTWAERRHVADLHREATLGLLYYLQHDPAVPAEVRQEWSKYGLPRDEFAANGHMPWEIYVRETRRLVGRAVFTEHDATLAPNSHRAPIHPDSIAITEWFLDSHACMPEEKGDSLYEGEFLLNNITWPGQVSYATLLPRDVDNLLVPVCLSCSHVGFGTIRLEPTWMNIAESAAYATALAIREGRPPSAVDPEELVQVLARHRVAIAFFNDVEGRESAAWYPAVQYLACRGFFGGYDARPDAKLSTTLARFWAGAAAQLVAGPAVDPAQRAVKALQAEEQADAATVTASEFAELLTSALPNDSAARPRIKAASAELQLPHDIPISRANACRLIFGLVSR